jgi:hypothetical protein
MAIFHFTRILRVFGLRLRATGARRKPYRRIRVVAKPTLESLEPRLSPSIAIQLDYSYDTNGFFIGHPDRQSLLTTAANLLAARIGDNLAAIVPNVGAGDTWTAVFTNPSTGNSTQINNLTVAANTIIIYAGGSSLGGAIGIGGPGGFNASGDQAWLDTVEGRGKPGTLGPANLQTAFAPWGGSVEFDTSFSNWYFGADPSGIKATQIDFLSAAEHEIAHVLGFGTANSWTNLVLGSTFIGPNAVAEYGGPVPTDAAGSAAQHWADGTTDKGKHCTMDPVFNSGERDAFTPLDFAGLEDLGWAISQSQPVGPGPYAAIVGVNSAGGWWAGMSTGSSFVNQFMTTWSTGGNWQDVVSGDFNGDGRLDVAGLTSTGDWWVGLNAGGSTFTWSRWTQWSTGVTWVDVQVGDFNNDGRADIVGRALQIGQWWVARSTASSFTNSLWSTWSTAVTWVDVKVGDFNGDHQADITGRVLQSGQWWTGLSQGTAFATSLWTVWSTGVTWVDVHAADLNGDGQTDIVGRALELGQWWVGQSNGSAFVNKLWATWSTAVTWVDVQVADFNNDGKADIAGMVAETGQWWVGKSTGSTLSSSLWTSWSPSAGWMNIEVGDFTGDGKMDIAGRTSWGDWWVAASTGSSFINAYWGTWSTTVNWPDIFEGKLT